MCVQVLARSSPEDKLTLVSMLKKEGEVVAVTGAAWCSSLYQGTWLLEFAGTCPAAGECWLLVDKGTVFSRAQGVCVSCSPVFTQTA
jgi:hypothetical protein